MKLYGIKHVKYGHMGISVSSNGDADFCNETSVSLDFDCGMIWTCDSLDQAYKVLQEPVAWYNSSIAHPSIGHYSVKDLEVFEVGCD